MATIFAACLFLGAPWSGEALAAEPSPIVATLYEPAAVYPGFLLWHQADELRFDVDNVTLLTDSKGGLVHRWETNLTGGGTPAYLLENGGVARTGIRDKRYARRGPVASADSVQLTDRNGNVVWELRAQSLGGPLFHHDIEVMPTGNLLISTYEPLLAEQARAIGWDPGEHETIWADGVIEVKPDLGTGSHEIVWRWNIADHIVQNRDPAAPNYGVIADSPHRIDPHYPKDYAPTNVVRQHVNSVDYNEELDQVLLSVFLYNEIWIIDHSTSIAEAASSTGGRSTRGGDLLFRFGNPAAYGRGDAGDRLFLKQHDANWIDEGLPGAGHILVHNNNAQLKMRRPGAGRPSPAGDAEGREREPNVEALAGRSNVYELKPVTAGDAGYALNADGRFHADTVWFWEHEDYFADFQGGARRLPNGNTLVTDTTDYLVVEVSSDGAIVAKYEGAAPVFKAFKYSSAEVTRLQER